MPAVAVVGASSKPERYSHQAVQGYLRRGYTVWPVHPAGIPIGELSTCTSLQELPGRPEIVTMYVNPKAGLQMLDDIVAVQPLVLWLNPGADSDELQQSAEARGLRVMRACNLVALSYGDPLETIDGL